MNKISSQTTDLYDHVSGSNPSLITAGLPSSSIMTARLLQPSSTIKQNHHLNQNRATDTQPVTLNSQQNDTSQYTTLSHRTISDTYLNLSRKDINDVMTALHTLAQCVQEDADNKNQRHKIPIDDNECHHLKMLYSNSANHTLKSSTQVNSSFDHYYYHPRYSIRNRRHSLSSDRWLNRHHHIKRHLNLVEDFQHDLYNMKRKQEHRILRQLQYHQNYFNHHNPSSYPSYSSNAILYTSTCRSNIRPRQIYHCSRQHPSTIKTPSEDQYQQSIKKALSSSIPLSSYILDKLIYVDQKELISNIQILPQQAHTLQILQNNHLHSFMSFDSLNTTDIFTTPLIPCHLQNTNYDQTSGIGDQLNLNKIDVATQWSSQRLTPMCIEMDVLKFDSSSQNQNEQDHSKLHLTRTHSTILTELNQSITTIDTNHSTVNTPPISKTQSFINTSSSINDPCNIQQTIDVNNICSEKSSLTVEDKHELTKSITERFLTTLNIPTCKCSTTKLHSTNTNVKHSSIDDNITCISLDNDSSIKSSSLLPNKKKIKQTSIKYPTKRSRHHTSKSSKNNQTIKRSRLHHHSQPANNNQLMTIIQSYQAIDRKEDSSFDFFDIDTTFCDTYDRLFTDTIKSEKSS